MASASLSLCVAQADARLACHEELYRRFRHRVFGKLLALSEAEDHGSEPVVMKDRTAQDAIRKRRGFFGEVKDVRQVVMVRSWFAGFMAVT